MNPFSIPPLVCSLLAAALGLLVYLHNKKSQKNISFGLLCLSTFWWQFSWFALFNTSDNHLATFLIKLGYTGIVFIPFTFYHFVVSFLGIKEEKKNVMLFYVIAFAFIVILWKTNLLISGYYTYFWGHYPKAGFLHPLFLFCLFFSASRGLIFLIKSKKSKSISPNVHNQLKYSFVGFIIYAISAVDFIVNYGFEIYPIGFIPVILSLSIFAYTVLRLRLMDINIALTRAGLFAIVYFPVVFLPFWIAPRFIHTGFWWIPVLLMGILATFGVFIYNSLRRRAEAALMKEDLKKYNTLEKFSRTLGLIRDLGLDGLTKLIVYRLVKTLNISYGTIYLLDDEEDKFVLKASHSLKGVKPSVLELYPDNDFIKFIKFWRKGIAYEDLQKITEQKANNKKGRNDLCDVDLSQALIQMERLMAKLAIPHFLKDELSGFLILGDKVSSRPYSEADIEVLTTLSRSVGLAITNAISMIKLRNREREFADAARIIEIGNYASGTEHQLGNVLNSIVWGIFGVKTDKTITNLLQHSPEALSAFNKKLDAIITDAKDGGTIVKEIRDYSQQGSSKEHKLTNLKEVLDKALRILLIHVNKFQNIDILIDIAADVPDIMGSPVGLQQVFINMFNNGYDSIQEMKEHINSHPELGITDYKGRIEIHISRVKGKVEIHIIDNGKGMTEDVARKLFAPHFTTKGSNEKRKEMNLNGGTGIGLYIMRRIIFDHGGTIDLFRTEPLKGVDFIIQLPVPKQ